MRKPQTELEQKIGGKFVKYLVQSGGQFFCGSEIQSLFEVVGGLAKGFRSPSPKRKEQKTAKKKRGLTEGKEYGKSIFSLF